MGIAQRSVAIPTGSVTLLFTDIEGSTKVLQRTGDRYADILAAHHVVLRGAIAEHSGYEVDTAGDGFFVTFVSAKDAVRCVIAMQRAINEHPLLVEHAVRVRMGLHSGDVQVVDNNYLGLTVHHAARIAGAGHGGQVVVSDATRALAGEDDEWSYLGLGAHELKNLARPIQLFQLAHPALDTEFKPIRSLSRGQANRVWAESDDGPGELGYELDRRAVALLRAELDPAVAAAAWEAGEAMTIDEAVALARGILA